MSTLNFKVKNGITIGVADGTAPIITSSTTVVTNLNADLLDGQQGSYYTNPVNLTAVVPITKGGTGQATANSSLNALLPSQTGNNGKVLTTDGTDTSWVTASGGGASIPLINDTTTNASYYPTFATVASGTLSLLEVSTSKLFFNPSTGTFNATTFNSLSDLRLKTNIIPIDNATNIINQLSGVKFDWKDTQLTSYGVIAQELELVIPELVETGDVKTVNYVGIIAFLINAVKELNQRINMLESN
ncbi:MAG: tail fiber domain-containing protein [Nitrososphaeraceae archaeon]